MMDGGIYDGPCGKLHGSGREIATSQFISIEVCTCTRCETEPGSGVPFSWQKRIPGRPKRCPNCNSPRWDVERRLPRRTDRTEAPNA